MRLRHRGQSGWYTDYLLEKTLYNALWNSALGHHEFQLSSWKSVPDNPSAASTFEATGLLSTAICVYLILGISYTVGSQAITDKSSLMASMHTYFY